MDFDKEVRLECGRARIPPARQTSPGATTYLKIISGVITRDADFGKRNESP